MSEVRKVMITGAAGFWGSRLAEALVRDEALHVIGLDTSPLEEESLDFILADVRNPALAELLQAEQVQVVCHLPSSGGHRSNDRAVQGVAEGTRRLLDACAQAGVGRVVLMSSTMVYGAHPDNDAFLMENAPLRAGQTAGHAATLAEMESIRDEFERREESVEVTTLRFANVVGPTVDSPMTRLLSLQPAPVLLGFDPMMQLIHQDDVVAALAHAVTNDVPGVFNVGAEPAMPLARILRLARRVPLPVFHPFARWSRGFFQKSRRRATRYAPFDWEYLRYSWVADLRRMHEELGFEPQFSAVEAIGDLASRHKGDDENELLNEAYLQDVIEKRRRTDQV